MLITESLMMLFLKDAGGLRMFGPAHHLGLAGAVVADAVLTGRLQLSSDHDARLVRVDPARTGNRALDAALERLSARQGRTLGEALRRTVVTPAEVGHALADAGVVSVTQGRLLGLRQQSFPTVDPEPEADLRAGLAHALATGTPTTQESLILSLLQTTGLAAGVLKEESGGMNSRELNRRIEEIVGRSGPEAAAVSAAMQQMAAAATSALAAVTVVTMA